MFMDSAIHKLLPFSRPPRQPLFSLRPFCIYYKPLITIRISSIIIVATVAAGCGFPRHHFDPPVVLAERTSSVGVITQLIEQRGYTTEEYFLTPEGSHKAVTYDYRYYLQEKDKPRWDLPIKNTELERCEKFAAVEGTNLWVGAGAVYSTNTKHPVGHPLVDRGQTVKSFNENDFYILVFDDQQILTHRQFLVISRLETTSPRFRFEDGNCSVVFLSPTGPQKYNILKDSEEDAGPATWNPPHL
jgi:hypothetical protein